MTVFYVHSVIDQPQNGASVVVRRGRRYGLSIKYKITPCWVTLFQPDRQGAVLGHSSSLRSSASLTIREEIRVEEKKEEFLCPLSWSVHHNLARKDYTESTTCCCVLARFLGMEKSKQALISFHDSGKLI
jgi:hypothetical protein